MIVDFIFLINSISVSLTDIPPLLIQLMFLIYIYAHNYSIAVLFQNPSIISELIYSSIYIFLYLFYLTSILCNVCVTLCNIFVTLHHFKFWNPTLISYSKYCLMIFFSSIYKFFIKNRWFYTIYPYK